MKSRIIIIGGGFAGLQLARHINTRYYDILLLDRLNHHQFQPLFYQVASAQLEPSSISFPFRKIFQRKKGISIRMTEVQSIDPGSKTVQTDIGPFNYDYLVIATGCRTNYFNNNLIEKNALPLKSTYDAISIRNRVIKNFENIIASKTFNEDQHNIVIVGAGPTGVELAGAFAEMKKHILPHDYPEINTSKVKIILVEGSDKTLRTMSALSQDASLKYLKNLGVEIILNTFVKNYSDNLLLLSNGDSIASANVIWTAGVTGNIIRGIDPSLIQGNRYLVNRYNGIQENPEIFAIGDIALMVTPRYPKGHPQVANVAINQAKMLAKNFNRMARSEKLAEFEYHDQGSMATVGKYKATVDLPSFSFKGFFAWVFWMFLHLMLILSVKNKLIIFINWVWGFFTNDTSLRLILTDNDVHSNLEPEASALTQ